MYNSKGKKGPIKGPIRTKVENAEIVFYIKNIKTYFNTQKHSLSVSGCQQCRSSFNVEHVEILMIHDS